MKLYSLRYEVAVPAWRSVPVKQTAPNPTVIVVDGADVEVVKHRRWIHLRLVDGWYRVEMRHVQLFTYWAGFRTIRGKIGK